MDSLDHRRLDLPHNEVGKIWFMCEVLGWHPVHMAISHYDMGGITDEGDRNEIIMWRENYHQAQVMRVLLDFAYV